MIVCLGVRDGTGEVQNEMKPASGCSIVGEVIDQGHQKIIMKTSLAAW